MKSVLIAWNKAHNLGIPIIDEQHRGVVSQINSMFYVLGMENNHELLASMVEIIHLESRVHFAIEEDLMARSGYPGYIDHKEQHRVLYERLCSMAAIDNIINDPTQFLNHLKDWWIDHINQDDREFAEHVRNFLVAN